MVRTLNLEFCLNQSLINQSINQSFSNYLLIFYFGEDHKPWHQMPEFITQFFFMYQWLILGRFVKPFLASISIMRKIIVFNLIGWCRHQMRCKVSISVSYYFLSLFLIILLWVVVLLWLLSVLGPPGWPTDFPSLQADFIAFSRNR